MVLYAFAATPVQLWHHHNYSATEKSGNRVTASIFKSTDKSAEVNCQICSHQYSTYFYNTDEIFVVPVFLANPKEGFYYTAFPSSPLFDSSNKGPPALA